jgi:putative MATE family efflux protein
VAENFARATLIRGSLWAALSALALPALGSNLLQSLSGTVSTLWVGRLLGPAALTATANAHLVIWITTSLIGGVATAAGLLVGRAIGQGDPHQVKSIVGSNLTLIAAVSVLVALVGLALSPQIIGLLAVPADAGAAAVIYLRLMFITIPITNLLSLLIALLHGGGETRVPLLATIVLVVLDAVLAPLLIGGWGAWQGWGITGAGIAYGGAHLVSLVCLWLMASRRPHRLTVNFADRAAFRPNPFIVRQSLGGGALVGLQYGLIALASLSLMGLVNRYGSQTAAAYGVAVTIWSFVQMPIQSVAGAASSIAAQSAGAAAWTRVRKVTLVACGANLALTAGMIVLTYVLNPFLVKLFLPGQAAAATIAMEINETVLWGFLLMAVTMVLFGILRAVGDMAVPFAVVLISHGLVRVPFAYLLEPHFGAPAIWWSYPVGLGVALAMILIYVAAYPPWRHGSLQESVHG